MHVLYIIHLRHTLIHPTSPLPNVIFHFKLEMILKFLLPYKRNKYENLILLLGQIKRPRMYSCNAQGR